MKKIFLSAITIALFLNLKSFAQIPNAGFESWATITSYMNPDNWSTSNATSVQYNFGSTVVRSDSFHAGNHSMQLQTGSFSGQNFPGVATNGIATIGIGTVSIVGGSPWAVRSAMMSGFYEYNSGGLGNDSAMVTVILLRRVATGRDTIAVGKKSLGNQLGFSQFDINLTYKSSWLYPDTALIVIQSSEVLLAAQPATWLRVDDLAFSGNVIAAVNNVNTIPLAISVYPNPATETLIFSISNISNAKTLIVYDILGKKIKAIEITSNQMAITTDGMNSSVYFYQVADRNNNVISTGKFSVKK